MINSQIIFLVIGSCLVTFIASVLFAINMATIKPKQLAKIIKEDPVTFVNTLKESVKEAEQQMAKKALEEQFKNPLKIETEGRVTFGKEDAPITIVEFADFQCFYCAKASKNMSALRERYAGKVKLVYKNFPLSFHAFAKPAAEHFEAVALISHDKAREFHDEIFYNFDNYAKLNDETEINKALKKIIKKIDVNMKEVQDNLEEAKKTVKADMDEALKLGVGGTPSFFINGIDAKGGRFEMIIDKLLKDMEK